MTPEPMYYPERRPPDATGEEVADLAVKLALYATLFAGGMLVGWMM